MLKCMIQLYCDFAEYSMGKRKRKKKDTKNRESKPPVKWKEIITGFCLSYLLLPRGLFLRREGSLQALLVVNWLNCPFWISQNSISHFTLREKTSNL